MGGLNSAGALNGTLKTHGGIAEFWGGESTILIYKTLSKP